MVRFPPIADIRRGAQIEAMTASNDNEEFAALRYFLQCYWHQNADLVEGDLRATTEAFASQEKAALVRGLLADLAEVGARGLFSAQWPKKGPIYDFWGDLGDRILSQEEADLIAKVAERNVR
jgi:hypothetical protein